MVESWQERSLTCAAAAAGVASVMSAVETSPVRRPDRANASSTVSWSSPGASAASDGPCEMRPSIVFTPVENPLAVAAESDT